VQLQVVAGRDGDEAAVGGKGDVVGLEGAARAAVADVPEVLHRRVAGDRRDDLPLAQHVDAAVAGLHGGGLAVRARDHAHGLPPGREPDLPALLAGARGVRGGGHPLDREQRVGAERRQRGGVARGLPPVPRPQRLAIARPDCQAQVAGAGHPGAVGGHGEVVDAVVEEDVGEEAVRQALRQPIEGEATFELAVVARQVEVVALGRLQVVALHSQARGQRPGGEGEVVAGALPPAQRAGRHVHRVEVVVPVHGAGHGHLAGAGHHQVAQVRAEQLLAGD
jgi:hypothetical protein